MLDFLYMQGATLATGTTIDAEGNIEDRGAAEVLFPGGGADFLHVIVTSGAAQVDNTLRVELVGADDALLTSSLIVIGSTPTFSPATQAAMAGYQFVPVLLGKQTTAKRYYGIRTICAGTTPAFIINAWRSNQGLLIDDGKIGPTGT